jgi:transcriptional regulator with PAS, ATPase and Fis domain
VASAIHTCPRGAIDPLIVLEATKGVCLSLSSGLARGAAHFDRALAACKAIGHRYHERWIERDRQELTRARRETVRIQRHDLDLTDAALLLSDAATILGAGRSIDLLAHAAAGMLRSVRNGAAVEVTQQSGRPHQVELTATTEAEADGTFTIRLRGSDRAVTIRISQVQSLDEILLVRSVAELVRVAVSRTAENDTDDDEQNLWPRSMLPGGEDAVFRSPRMTELLKIAVRLAATNLPILLTGETGTGKEVFARIIHEHSQGKRGPFVPYNCSAMSRDLVESQLFGHRRGAFTGATDSFPGIIRAAERGTLFLDEVGDLDPAIQPKLLRFLEGAEIHSIGELKPQLVPVRIVAATNADLDDLVDQQRFRRDLFYRLGVAKLALPPLRERKDEIPALASLFLERYSRECRRTGLRLGDDVIAALLLYDWPGNIRQLGNEIRRVVAMAEDGQRLTAADLDPEITRKWNSRAPLPAAAEDSGPFIKVRLDQPLEQAVEALERQFIERAMEASSGRVAEAAQLLGISRKGLFLKRRRRGLVAK